MNYSNCTLTLSYEVHIFRKIYYMKPQTGILIPAHSYSKQYLQPYQSQSIPQIHTVGEGAEGPRHTAIYIHIYTRLYHILAISRASEKEMRGWRRPHSALGSFLSRAVDSRVGKLLIKRGIHVGLEEREQFAHTSLVLTLPRQLYQCPGFLSLLQFIYQVCRDTVLSSLPLLYLITFSCNSIP
jgi:hypothetical protein